MAKTISELKAQSAEVKNASAIGENTATRVGQLFGDIVEHVEQYENTKNNKDASQDAQMQSLVSAEESRAKGEERGLQNQIHAEKIDRQTADTYLGNLIQQESSARETADENIRTALANETARAQAAEQELAAAQIYTSKIKDGAVTTPKIADGAVTYEKTDIIAQELGTNMTKVPSQKVVTDAIQKEEKERKADVDGLVAALASETINREQNDSNLNAAIEAEAEARDNAVKKEETERKADVDGLVAALASETINREQNDALLNQAIIAEKDRAEAREQELTVVIQQETERAEAAEAANKKSIDSEIERSKNEDAKIKNEINEKASKNDVAISIDELKKSIGERTEIIGDVTNNPDEEDLTTNEENKIKLKDRIFEPLNYSGRGYTILRKKLRNILTYSVTIGIDTPPLNDGYISLIFDSKEFHINVSKNDTTTDVCKKISLTIENGFSKYEVAYTDTTIKITSKYEFEISEIAISPVDTGATFNGIIKEKKETLINYLSQDSFDKKNTIYVIRYDFNLNNEELSIPEGCELRFDGGSISNGSLIGNDTSINASLYQIFDNIQFYGIFTTKFYVEWWGASSNKSNNEIFINKALHAFDITSSYTHERKRYTIFFIGRYEINDTIYISPYTSMSGCCDDFGRSRYSVPQSTFLVNFSEPNKWIIDTTYSDGTVIPFDILYTESGIKYDTNFGFNISGIHFRYIDGSAYVYGGIRLSGVVSEKICNIDLSLGVFIGIALLNGNWNTEIRNVLVYSNLCGIYLGPVSTTLTFNNVYLLNNDNTNVATEPKILETSLPPYTDVQSYAILMEEAAATFYGCIFQGYDALIIGTDYNAYFNKPYIELIRKTIGWLHATKTKVYLSIEGFQQGVLVTESYAFGTIKGCIIAKDFSYCTCYTPNDEDYIWTYPSYFIEFNENTNSFVSYYDDFEIDENGYPVNCKKSKYKKLILKNEKSDFTDVYCHRNDATLSIQSKYMNNYLNTGFSSTHPTCYSEVFKREYNNVLIIPMLNRIDLISNAVIVENKNIGFKIISNYTKGILFKSEPLRIKNSVLHFISNEVRGLLYDSNSITEYYFEVFGNTTFNFIGNWYIYRNLVFLKLSGDSQVNVNINIRGTYTGLYFENKECVIFNTDFEYLYNININFYDSDGNFIKSYHYTNISRPTKGLSEGMQIYDNELKKPIWWNGEKWIDATGNEIS